MITKVYGVVRHKAVNHDLPVELNSGVLLAEAVQVWVDSLKRCQEEARFYFEHVRGFQPWRKGSS
jgi:hypothetical protein